MRRFAQVLSAFCVGCLLVVLAVSGCHKDSAPAQQAPADKAAADQTPAGQSPAGQTPATQVPPSPAAAVQPAAGQTPTGQVPSIPPASAYVPTEIQSVHGGLVYCVSVQQTTHEVYVAAETMRGGFFGVAHNPNNGTWKSTDGKTWQRIGPGGNNVKVSQTDPKVIYANDMYGLYRTADGGATWQTIIKGRPLPAPRTPDTMPTNVDPDTIPPHPDVLGYKALDIFAGDSNIVYAGTPGLLRESRDGGKTWQHHPLPPDKNGKPPIVQVVQVHPTNPDIVFMAYYGGRGGIWKTTDGGKTIQQIGAAVGRAMAVAPSNPDVIYTAAAVTHDGGKTWKNVPSGAWCIAVHPRNAEVAYYSRPGSPVWATIDGGQTFMSTQGVGANYDGTEVEGLAIDAQRDIIWAGGDMIWQGAGASTGKVRLIRSDTGFHVISLADIQSVPSGVWAASDAQGIHYTRDGKTWITTAMGMNGTDALHRVAPSPVDPNIIYAGHETRLFKSVDGGKSWFNIYNKWFPYCIIDPVDPNVVYFSTHGGLGLIVRSIDGGATFDELGKGRFLAVRPGESKTVYAEKEDGLYVSRDRAEHMEKISDQTKLGDFFISPSHPDRMFSARGTDGFFHSEDGGKTWAAIQGKLAGPSRMTELADGTIWLSDPATGLVRSGDGGQSWQLVWDSVGAICPDPWDAHSLYMATRGGIWWVHPKDVTRPEQPATPPTMGEATTVDLTGPIFADRPNTTYRLTGDIELKGLSRSLVLMPRGMKKITIDGQGHSVRCSGGYGIFGDDEEDITIRNIRFVFPAGSGAGIYLSNVRNLKVDNCTFEGDSGTSIFTEGVCTDNVTIENCRFRNSGKLAAITGNGPHIVRNCTFAAGTPVRIWPAAGQVFENNTVPKPTTAAAPSSARPSSQPAKPKKK